ncbi:MAG TPA: transglycosylase family protein [Mycobacterium sp.]|nr:transglycosylase family protein [Mycobacterium sp.]
MAAAAVCAAVITGSAGAETVNWNAVAQCESGGNWAANTGNGAYGGLQIEPSTWAANGGTGLPSQASEQEQIAVANRILATQGPGAWPTCLGGGLGGGAGMAPIGSLTHLLTGLLGGGI